MLTRPTLARMGAIAALTAAAWACGDDGAGPGGAPPSTSSTGAGGEGGGWDPRFDAFVEALRQDLAESGGYGVSVAIMESGQITFAHAFGSKDAAGLEPLETSTLMQIGSVTKPMTAALLLRDVEAGAVALDDTLGAALPALEFARDESWDDTVTLHHVLSHQSGLVDTLDWLGSGDDAALADFFYGHYATEGYVMAPPGTFYNYSNAGLSYAGLISETLDARRWPDIVREDVLLPLGMTRTFARRAEVEADGDYAIGYGYTLTDLAFGGELGEVPMEEVTDAASARPAANIWSTPSQMMQWAAFIRNGSPAVLSDALRSEITTPHVTTGYLNGTRHYGYGMALWDGFLTTGGTYYPMPVWFHGGNTNSFTTDFWVLPEQDFALCIIVSGIVADFDHSVDVAMETLVDLPEPATAPLYTVDPSTFGRHVGTYVDPFRLGRMIIEDAGGTLTIAMPDFEAAGVVVEHELAAVSSDIFLVRLNGIRYDLTFFPETSGGRSVYLRNRSFVGRRHIPADELPLEPPVPDSATVQRMLRQWSMHPGDRRVWKAAGAWGD